jgi:hypothetical protein
MAPLCGNFFVSPLWLLHCSLNIIRLIEWKRVRCVRTVVYEVVSKIFRNSAAIYTAVVVARSTGPNRPNWIPGSAATFCGVCVKTCEDVAPNFGENRPGCFTMTTLRLSLPTHPAVSGEIKNGCHPSHTVSPHLAPCDFFLFQKMKQAERTPVRYRWGYPGRIAECFTLWQKRTFRKRSKMEETVGPVSTCRRELFRGWWLPIGLMARFMGFTASVRNILDTSRT